MRYVHLALPLLTALLTGCASTMPMEVYSSFGPGVKYEGVAKTFSWSPAATQTMRDQEAERPYLHGMVVAAVEGEMTRKGYTLTSDKADLWIAYEVNQRQQVEGLSGEAYQAGIYGITIFDPETSKKMYSAGAKIRLEPNAPPEQRKSTAEDATRKMLAQFPNSKHKK